MKQYKAVFFDWDGTAVMSRRADASGAIVAMEAALKRGIRLVIISGTTYENICGGKIAELLPKELLRNLFLGLGRGNYNYGFTVEAKASRGGRSATRVNLMDNTPDLASTIALHNAAYDFHRIMLEQYELPTDIVFTRPNYCKIDIMANKSRAPEALFLQADEVDHVNSLLKEHCVNGGLHGLLQLAEDTALKSGLRLKATTDAKYLELGYTTKSDNVNHFMDAFQNDGITAEDCCFWGDEFGAISDGVWGSDQQMITPKTSGGDFFSVSDIELPLPHQVRKLGGGPARFIEFLRELAEAKL